MKFLSLCSGIEAASVAFGPLGWQAVAFSEIEPFPCALLAHHYPDVPNLGDMTRWRTWPDALLLQVEILVGGTPCQAFSLAGLRQSLDDTRGNLTLIYCEIYAHINALRRAAGLPPALCLWENVPGVLSTKDNAFGCFLAGLAGESDALQPPGGRWADAGYVSGPSGAAAYRTLDAQYFSLAQRRRRVFVVGSPDPAFDPAAVLFEFHGLRRDTPPRRQTGETTATTLSARTQGGGGLGTDAECDGTLIAQGSVALPEIAPTLLGGGNTSGGHRPPGSTVDNCESLIPTLANCLTRRMSKGPNTTLNEGPTLLAEVTHSLRAEGFDASEDVTGRGTPLVPIAFSAKDHGADSLFDLAPTLRAGGHDKSHANSGNWAAIAFPGRLSSTQSLRASSSRSYIAAAPVNNAVAFAENSRHEIRMEGGDGTRTGALSTGGGKPGQGVPMVALSANAASLWRVRRLVCEECELLQGFPLGYTLIPHTSPKKRKGTDLAETTAFLLSLDIGLTDSDAATLAHSPDGPRYKALGNSWPVRVVRWIALRIQQTQSGKQPQTLCSSLQPQ